MARSILVLSCLVALIGLDSPAWAEVLPPLDRPVCPSPPPADAEPGWWLLGGGSLYFLKPYAGNNTAYQTTTTSVGTAGDVAVSQGQTTPTQFSWNFEPAGAYWLGLVSPSGLGLRGRYFRFSAGSSNPETTLTPQQAATPLGVTPAESRFVNPSPFISSFLPGTLPPAGAGRSPFGSPGAVLLVPNPNGSAGIGEDHLRFSSDLTIDAVDVEPTFTWGGQGWSLLAGAGGRYLHLAQTYRASLTNLGGGLPINETQTLEVLRNFNGGGPTVSGQVNWNVGPTNLAVFAGARGSLLVGRSTQTTSFTQTLNDPTGLSGIPGTPVNSRIASRIPMHTDLVLPVAEFEAGLEYGVEVFGNRLFVRGAVVNQTYFDAGNASGGSGNLSLFGGQMSLGMNY